MSMPSFRSDLSRARGLGSAKEGAHHWWLQRVTAIAMVPLVVWFVIALIGLQGADYDAMVAWLGAPINAVLMVLFVGAAFYHASLGVQVIIEDYVSHELYRRLSILGAKFALVFGGVACVFSTLKIAFGG